MNHHPSTIDFKSVLNEQQYAAVTAPDGPLLVLAAAGTGKTRTLVHRVAFLVERGITPDRLLLLTFTNRAAGEMLERAQDLVGGGVGGIWAGTFHHMANRMLRRHASLIGFQSDYVILDRDDSRSLVSGCVKDRKLKTKDFPKPDVLLSLFGTAANTCEPLADVLERRFSATNGYEDDILKISGDYIARKRDLGSMDFDDMLVNCRLLLKQNPDVLARYQQQFLHVLVDEYQDTNQLQAELVDCIGSLNGNVMVVGDDFQSIYSWRGADYRNIMSFPERYPGAAIHKLETNYRSVPEILEVANACIAGNPKQYSKTLRPTREGHRRPIVAKLRDGGEQSRFVIDHIASLRREGYRLSDIAVLYRAHFHSMELQMELTRNGVNYAISSGVRFFEQAHIKDVCSVLRLLAHHGDEMAFVRLLSMLPGMGEKTSRTVWTKLGGSFDAGNELQRAQLPGLLRASARADWKSIDPVLAAYKNEELHGDGGEVVHRFLRAFYEAYANRTFENADRRVEDVHELILYTAKFETVDEFLNDVALLTNLDAEINGMNTEEEALRLSTVHQAKGLEWSAVIVLWATDNMFPSSRSLQESPEAEAEERRLFYVAVTRAKDELCLCVPEVRRTRDGGVIYCEPSRFVTEVPRQLLSEVRPVMI